MTPPPTVRAEPRAPSCARDSIAPRLCPPHSGATGPGHRLSGGLPPPPSLLSARPPSLPDDGRAGSVGRTGDQCWLGRSGHHGPGPPLGAPPPIGCGLRGAGGLEAGLVSLSHHKVLPWAGRGSAGGPGRASALRTLLPGQLPPLAAPPPSSALGGAPRKWAHLVTQPRGGSHLNVHFREDP